VVAKPIPATGGAAYIPDAGDIVWIGLDPVQGHEQAGHRPFFVLSPRAYNQKTGLLVGCACTRQTKGYPFEVALPDPKPSVVLADQIRTLDWRARRASLKARVPAEVLGAVRDALAALIL
jgi:mRNA interferase MazF